jgi:hypothetical protein
MGKFKKIIIWMMGMLAGLAAIAFIFPYFMSFMWGQDDPVPNDSDLLLVKAELPKEENFYYDLLELDKIKLFGDFANYSAGSIGRDKKALAEIAQKNSAALSVFARAAAKPAFLNMEFADPDNFQPGKFSGNSARHAARVSSAKAIYDQQVGREREAFEEAFKILEVGDKIEKSQNVTLMNYLAGLSIKQIGFDTLRELIVQTNLSSRQLGLYQDRVNEFGSVANADIWKIEYLDFKRNFEAMIDNLDDTIRNKTKFNYYYKPNKTLALKADYYRKLIENCAKDCSVGLDIEKEPYKAEPIKMMFTENSIGELIVDFAYVSFYGVKNKRCQRSVEANMIELLFAVKRYKIEQGVYPPSSESLVPKYIKQIPADVFSGCPLNYVAGGNYIYSVGKDLKDDGGDLSAGTFYDLENMDDPTILCDFK